MSCKHDRIKKEFTSTRSMLSYVGIERNDANCVVVKSDSKEARSLLARRHTTQRHADDVSIHFLALSIFVQLTSLKTISYFYIETLEGRYDVTRCTGSISK